MRFVLWLGIAAALVASALFNLGVVLQALDARVAPRSLALRLALLVRLVKRPRWTLGFLLGLFGVWPQVVAYANAPFVVVQPLLMTGLLVVLVLGERLLREPVGANEVVGVAAIIGGVVLVAWGAPSHSEAHRMPVAVLSVMAGLSLAGLAPFFVRGTRLDTGMLVILATGCGFGATNIATKLFGDDFNAGTSATAFPWGLVAIGMGIAATLTNMTAFQRRAATTVVPISTAVQTFLPIALEPLFLREQWASASFGGAPLVAGLLLALLGCVLISRSPAVSQLIARASE